MVKFRVFRDGNIGRGGSALSIRQLRRCNTGRWQPSSGMPEIERPLLIVAVLMLAWLPLLAGRILRHLAKIDARLLEIHNTLASPEDAQSSTSAAKSGGAFDDFLSEDTARRNLPKSEQFAAYLEWRRENGLNWDKS